MNTITSRQQNESAVEWQKREADAQAYLALKTRLMNEKDMIGWLCTVHRNKVQYENAPAKTVKKIQGQLNRASNLLSLAYLWALLEEGGFNENCTWVSESDRLELKAWKHVRHTGAHAPGGRARGYYSEFDQFMTQKEQGASGLRQNCKWDANSIELTDGMNHSFFSFASNLIDKALGHSANGNVPT